MKTPIPNLPHLARLAVLVLLSILHLQLTTIFAQDTLITYQGRLNDNGNPANGLYDLRFSLYDNSSGGLPVGNNVIQTAPVTNGLFTSSINFGASFAGANRWLQLEVRTNGSGAGYTVLDPRQRVTAAPYSIYALAAATAATAGSASNVVSGSVVSSVNALKDNVILQAGSNVTISPSGNTLTIASAGVGGSGIWSVLNNNAYYNAGNVGIGTTTPSLYGHGGTGRILEINNNGTAMHSQSHLMLFTGVNSLLDSAMGSVTWAQPGGMAAYIGAQTRSTTPNAPAAMLSFGTRQIGDGAASPKMVITEEGNVGIGTTAPTAGYRLEVIGATQLRPGNGTVQFGSPNAELGLSITPTVGNRADLRFDGSILKLVAGIGVTPPSATNGIAISTNGNVGIGTISPFYKLAVAGDAGFTGRILVNGFNSGGVTMGLQTRSGDNFPLIVRDSSGNPVFDLQTGGFNNLRMYGDAAKLSGGTSWSTWSDQRLKQGVRAYEPGLNEILQLRPVRFRYRDDPKRGLTSTHEEVGFIAQEVREVIPDAVTEDKDGYLSLKADPIHWAAINAIQELNTQLKGQRAENAELKQRLEKLEQRMNQNHGGVK